jgi:hypothetical protein
MNRTYGETAVGILLIIILSCYELQFSRSILLLKRQPQLEQAMRASNHRITFQSESGIDLRGNLIHPLPPTQADRSIIFLLRGTTLKADLDFWIRVKSLLPKESAVRLIGYCDGLICASTIRRSNQPPDFPIIEYGEIIGSQALINADGLGYSILRREQWLQPKLIKWRAPESTPQETIREVLE